MLYGYPLPFPFQYPPASYPYAPYPHYPPVVTPHHSDTAPGSTPTSPMKIALPQLISLAEFCEQYDVDDEDQGHLTKLKSSQEIAALISWSMRNGMAMLDFQSSLGMTSL